MSTDDVQYVEEWIYEKKKKKYFLIPRRHFVGSLDGKWTTSSYEREWKAEERKNLFLLCCEGGNLFEILRVYDIVEIAIKWQNDSHILTSTYGIKLKIDTRINSLPHTQC